MNTPTALAADASMPAPLPAPDGPPGRLSSVTSALLVLKAFSAASDGGIPMPNVPQMGSVWNALGGAWVNSTKGAGAMPAQKAFAQAQATVKKSIAGCEAPPRCAAM